MNQLKKCSFNDQTQLINHDLIDGQMNNLMNKWIVEK